MCPLYWGHDREGRLCVASEMKASVAVCADVAQFPPGHYYDSATGELTQYYRKPWRDYDATEGRGSLASRNCARPSSAPCIAS